MKCTLCSCGTSLAACDARPGFVLLTYLQLTWRATTLRTYLLKVGEPDPLKVNILPAGWKRCTRMDFRLCLRKEGAHAIVRLPSPLIKPLHHIISTHDISSQQTAPNRISSHFKPLSFIPRVQVTSHHGSPTTFPLLTPHISKPHLHIPVLHINCTTVPLRPHTP